MNRNFKLLFIYYICIITEKMPTSYVNVDTESLGFFFRKMRVFLTVFIFVFYIDAFFTQIISIVMK